MVHGRNSTPLLGKESYSISQLRSNKLQLHFGMRNINDPKIQKIKTQNCTSGFCERRHIVKHLCEHWKWKPDSVSRAFYKGKDEDSTFYCHIYLKE